AYNKTPGPRLIQAFYTETTGLTYKTPLPEPNDEQHDYPNFSYPVQRRRRVVEPQPPSTDYHADEHPEIPRIRRASRYLEQPQTDRLPETAKSAPASRTRHGVSRGLDEPSTEENVAVPRRKRLPDHASTPVNQPPHTLTRPTARPRRVSRQVRSQPSYLYQLYALRRNPSVMFIGILALILLIITPIIVNVSRTSTTVYQN